MLFCTRFAEHSEGLYAMSGVLKPNWLRRWTGLCLAALVVLCCSCSFSHRQGAGVPLTELKGNLDPLRTAFNQDVGKVRLMLLLDPT